jgi:small subunit ribosomal protein S17
MTEKIIKTKEEIKKTDEGTNGKSLAVEKSDAKRQRNIGSGTAKHLSGVVVSDKMKDTVVVDIARFVKHPKYGKFMKRNKNIKAHDVGNTKKIGETVTIEECRPISKDKTFKIVA